MPRPAPLLALSGAAALAGLAGCGGDCVGVGCQEDFAAALVNVIDGSDLATEGTATLSPLDAWASVRGALREGPDWAVLATDDGLIAGAPRTGQVLSFAVAASDSQSVADSTGSLLGDQPDDRFGTQVVRGLDMDGDGSDELIVSAPRWDRERTTRQNGGVFLYNGLSQGIAGQGDGGRQADWVLSGKEDGARLGTTLAACPDVDGDGRGELLVGAPLSNRGARLAGQVFLLTGGRLDRGTEVRSDTLDHRWMGLAVGEAAGTALSCQHDLLGDGVAELVVGAPFADGDHEAEGAVYIIDGAGAPPAGDLDLVAARVLRGPLTNAWLGQSVATGDLNGDGLAEVVAGAPGFLRNSPSTTARRGAGAVLVWDGADLQAEADPLPRFRILGISDGDGLGRTVLLADIDGDGDDDLFMGAPRRTPDPDRADTFESGALYMLRGAPDYLGWRPSMTADEVDLIWEEERQFLRTGQALQVAELTGDGQLDLILLNRSD